MNILPLGTMIYHGTTTWGQISKTCPDCLGTARWKCVIPNGEEFTIECPRCYPGGCDTSTGIVKEDWDVIPVVRSGSITGIEIDSEGIIKYKVDCTIIEADKVCLNHSEAMAVAVAGVESHREYLNNRSIEEAMRRTRPKLGSGQLMSPVNTLRYCRSDIRDLQKRIEKTRAYAQRRGIDLGDKYL